MSIVTDVKGLIKVSELRLVNSSGFNTKALILCYTVWGNSWVIRCLAERLGVHGKSQKMLNL